MLNKLELQPVKPPNQKYIPKPYEKMQYPGQRVQVDVKFVPEICIVGDAKAEWRKFYQYTAINEYPHCRYLEAFEDFRKQLADHSRKYNNSPMRPLNWKFPSDYINAFLSNGQVF